MPGRDLPRRSPRRSPRKQVRPVRRSPVRRGESFKIFVDSPFQEGAQLWERLRRLSDLPLDRADYKARGAWDVAKLEEHVALLERAASLPGFADGEMTFLELYGLTGGTARWPAYVSQRGWAMPRLQNAILKARIRALASKR